MAKHGVAADANVEEELEPIEFEIVEQVTLSPCLKKLVLAVPRQAVDETYEKLLTEITKEAQIPGFRKGKVPRNLLAQRVGQRLRDETRNNCAERAVMCALEQLDLHPTREVEELERQVETEESPLRFTVEVEHRPAVELGDYRSIRVEETAEPVTEAAVAADLERLRRRVATIGPVEGRVARAGDLARVSTTASIDLQPWAPGCREDVTIEIGEDQFLPGFDEGLVGVLPGSVFVHECRVPEDYEDAELAGKTVTFRVTLKDLRERKLPDLDDDFAENYMGYESLQELKEELRKDLELAAQREAHERARERLFDRLCEMHAVTPPPSMVEARSRLLAAVQQSSLEEIGLGERAGELLADEEWQARNRERAARQAKISLILSKVAEAEGLEISDEQLASYVAAQAAARGQAPERYIERLKQDGLLGYYRQELLEQVVAERLLRQAHEGEGSGEAVEETTEAAEPAAEAGGEPETAPAGDDAPATDEPERTEA